MPVINLIAKGFTGPSTFKAAGPVETLDLPGDVMITGGVVLGNETNLPAGDPSVYGTAAAFDDVSPGPGLTQSITLTFSAPVTNFSVDIFNGMTTTATYQVSDNTGDSTTVILAANSAGGQQVAVLPNAHNATIITITAEAAPWDFSIDNITYNEPTLIELANFSADVYNKGTASTVSGWTAVGSPKIIGELTAQAYISADNSQVVVAIRGTVNPIGAIASLNAAQTLMSIKDISTDLSSFTAGTPSVGLSGMVANASQYLASIAQAFPNANITLTGHSLGGAVAELLGEASGYTAQTFNSPGAQALYGSLQPQLQAAANLKAANKFSGPDQNYRTVGDLVSLYGTSIGDQFTVENSNPVASDTLGNILTNHGITTVISDLTNNPTIVNGAVEPNSAIAAAPLILSGIGNYTDIGKGIVTLSFVANAVLNLIDPGSGNTFIYTETASSPLVTSVTFLADSDASSFEVSWKVNGVWLAPQTVTAGTTVSFGAGTNSFKYEGLSSGGQVVTLGDGYIFEATYAAASQVSATVQTLVGNVSDVSDFNGSGTSDILFRNATTGDTGSYQIANGANAGWNDVGASSTAYSVVGLGDFTGSGTDDILFRNSAGDTGFYQIVNGAKTAWVNIGSSSNAYGVVGVGDFTGAGTDDILFRNNSTGDTGFYDIVNGVNTGWHDIGASSAAYSIVGVGDFDGSGVAEPLFRNNTTGDTGFYAIVNGANTGWHDIGASSTAYSVIGVGDFMGNGTDDILFRNNTTGDTGFYAISNGVNTGWHDIGASSPAYSIVAVGDYMGNGTSDILFRNNATGDTGFYAISNGVNTGWHDVGASSTAYKVVA
jgi:hypothetical protein